MKKRNGVVLTAMALFLFVGASSLAYFTDIKTAKISTDAGSIVLKDTTVPTSGTKMVPGDSFAVPIKFTQTGKNPAKVRVRIINDTTNAGNQIFATKAATKGFALQKADKSVDIAGERGYVEELGVLSTGQSKSLTGVTVKLLEASGNEYQNVTTKLEYIIEAVQDDNGTSWTIVDNGTIAILAS